MKCRKSRDSYEHVTNGLNDVAASNLESEREQKEVNATNTKENNVSKTIESTVDESYMLPKDPLEYNGQWICNHCNGEVDGFTIYSLFYVE